VTTPLRRPNNSHQEDGFSVTLVLVASMMVLLGGLMLVDRANDGVISATFQRDSSDAKDAAETGMTRIVGELNRPQNRGLLAKKTSGADPASYRWTQADADASVNPCLGGTSGRPDLASNASLGYAANAPYNRVLLNANGQVVTNLSQATQAYQLLWVKRQPLAYLRIFQPTGRGKVVLAVEGSALRNGQTLSSVRLEEELQLVPKCCGVPFGGSHGNVNYSLDSEGASACIAANWGFLGGAAENNTGYIKINGVTTIETGGSNSQPLNPLFCIADSTADCDFDPTSTDYTLQVATVDLNPVPQVPTPAPAGVGSIARVGDSLSAAIKDTPLAFATCHNVELAAINQSNLSSTIAPGCKPADTSTVVFNAAVDMSSTTNHNYCKTHDSDGDGREELHCVLDTLDYSAFNIKVIGTGVRPLRLYFRNSGTVIRGVGGKTLEHSGGTKITDLSLFGCPNCGTQEVSLAGNGSSLNLFAWFPQGEVTISGTTSYSGVLWANQITSEDSVTWVVPGSGVAQAMDLAGHGVPPNPATTSATNPLVFDWVARAIEGFRWYGK
jgi:hypothetical protein